MYKYTFSDAHSGAITVHVTPFPDWQEFGQFADFLIQNENMTLLEKDIGMDRYQFRVEWQGKRFLLQFEHYTDSIWLESENLVQCELGSE